jgi:hypothetical protein
MGESPTQPVASLKDGAFWRSQIERAIQARKDLEAWWDANDRAYAPSGTGTPDAYGACINTNRDFTLVERKKADLFYQRPDVSLQPSPLLEGPIAAAVDAAGDAAGAAAHADSVERRAPGP